GDNSGTSLPFPPSWRAGRRRTGTAGRDRAAARRAVSFPMLDPLPTPFRQRRTAGPIPRICVPGLTDRRPIPLRVPCRSDDRIDAARLVLRLDALGRALDDLPARSRRFAHWWARRLDTVAHARR